MTAVEQGGTTIEPYFTVGMPPLMGVMTALVSSFVIGLGIAVTSAEVLRSAFAELRSVIELTIRKAIVPLLPFYIFGIFLIMTVSGQTGTILISFHYCPLKMDGVKN